MLVVGHPPALAPQRALGPLRQLSTLRISVSSQQNASGWAVSLDLHFQRYHRHEAGTQAHLMMDEAMMGRRHHHLAPPPRVVDGLALPLSRLKPRWPQVQVVWHLLSVPS